MPTPTNHPRPRRDPYTERCDVCGGDLGEDAWHAKRVVYCWECWAKSGIKQRRLPAAWFVWCALTAFSAWALTVSQGMAWKIALAGFVAGAYLVVSIPVERRR
jgi:hypothetical protein